MDRRGGVPREDRVPEQAADSPAFLVAFSGQTWIVVTACCWHWLLGVDDEYGNGTLDHVDVA